MIKLPVGQTIRFAYAFTFGQIGTIIGLIWIPTLINAVASFFATRAYYQALADSLESGAPPTGALLMPFLVMIVSTFLTGMIGIAIVREALAPRQGHVYAHISLGPAELRAFGGLFLLYMLLAICLVAFILVGGGAMSTAIAAGAPPAAGAIAGLILLGGLGAVIYGGVRLSFLLIPAVLEGNDFGIRRSWELTNGNFWRIVAVGLTTLVPVLLMVGIAESAILGPEIFLPDLGAAKNQAADLHKMAAQLRAMQTQLPLLVGVSFVISPLMYGLLFAPAAFAWRVLTGKAAGETA